MNLEEHVDLKNGSLLKQQLTREFAIKFLFCRSQFIYQIILCYVFVVNGVCLSKLHSMHTRKNDHLVTTREFHHRTRLLRRGSIERNLDFEWSP